MSIEEINAQLERSLSWCEDNETAPSTPIIAVLGKTIARLIKSNKFLIERVRDLEDRLEKAELEAGDALKLAQRLDAWSSEHEMYQT